MKPPADRYYDVVGWPDVTFVAHEARPLYDTAQLDLPHGTAKAGDVDRQRYLSFERGGGRVVLDRSLPHEAEYLAGQREWRVRVPLWVADEAQVPAAWRVL